MPPLLTIFKLRHWLIQLRVTYLNLLKCLHLSNVISGTIPKRLQKESILNLLEGLIPQIYIKILRSFFSNLTLSSFLSA